MNLAKHDDSFRILIVDDNKELREILEEYLYNEGDVIEGASNGKEALVKHGTNPFDLIITDLNMPELDGMELMRRIRRDSEVTEFIVITAYASLDTAVEAVRIGAFDYIVKPFRMEELKVAVKNVRDKVRLKKLNMELVMKLKGLYDEIERYRDKAGSTGSETGANSMENTEHILEEIERIGLLTHGKVRTGQ